MRHLVRSVVLAAAAVALLATPRAEAQSKVPGTFLVEGVLTSGGGGPAADGNYAIKFALYDKSAGGKQLWASSTKTVAVKAGRFSVRLGTTKPIVGSALANVSSVWMGMKVGADPEFARAPLNAVPYAIRSAWAHNIECKGCLNSGHIASGSIKPTSVGFAYAGAADGIKGGDAKVARSLKCTGCVSVAHMKFDKDVNLGPRSLAAAKLTSSGDVIAAGTIAGKQFIGDGSKLTGIKTPAGECKNKGEVVKGINPDGSLKCIQAMDPANLPKDGISAISNGLVANQFIDIIKGGQNKPIPDNSPPGVLDAIDFPDIGIAQELEVNVHVKNSDLSNLVIWLFPPNAPNLPANRTPIIKGYPVNPSIDAKVYPHYLLHRKNGKKGATMNTKFPTATKPLTGDIHKDWLNKNIKGKWRLLVTDTAYLNNKTDGAIVEWSIRIKTLSNKQITVNGNQFTSGKLYGKYQGSGKDAAPLEVGGDMNVGGTAYGSMINSHPVYGEARNYTVVMILDKEHTKTNKVCPDGFTFLKSYDYRANDGDVMVGVGTNGSLLIGSQNSWGYGYDYMAMRFEWSHSRSICYRTYKAPRGRPFASVLGAYPITSKGQCPTGYEFVSINDCNGTNNDYCNVYTNKNGLMIGNADSYSFGSNTSNGSMGGHHGGGRSHYNHTRGVCWKLYGVEGTPKETWNGMFTMGFGMHPNKTCPKGFHARATNDIDRNDNWFYSTSGRYSHFFGGWNSFWHGGSRFYHSWRQDYVKYYCWQYFPITGKPSYDIRMARYQSGANSCPKGWIETNGSDVKGWNDNGYMQAGSHSFYLGGLSSWSYADVQEGYLIPHATSYWSSARMCIKINGVKWPF